MTALLLLMSMAFGADWLAIQGNEPDDPDKARFRPGGFVQVSVEGYPSKPVTGLESEALQPYEGQRAVFNTVGPSGRPFGVLLRRVRAGGRGVIPGTEGIVSANVAVELGQNPLTTTADGWLPKLMDASLSLHSPWGVHLRLGQFKLPLSDEALEAVHITSDTIRFALPTGRLLMERDASEGVYSGTVNGFRDVGGQLYGAHRMGDVEVSWAGMVSAGSVLFYSTSPGVDLTGRLQISWRLDDRDRAPDREELSAWGFATSGRRELPDDTFRRTRAGAGIQLQKSGVRLRGEFLWADGVLTDGMKPPFQGGAMTIAPEGEAWGVTGLASVRFLEKWELGVLYSHLDSQPDGGPARRVFDEATGFAQFHLFPQVWFDLNAGWRGRRAPEGSSDVDRILDTTGPYLGFMATARL